MDELRREMQERMSTMAPMMQGRGTGGGMMGQNGKLPDSNTRLQIMEKRIDIMQMMMQMMMEQGMEGPMGSGEAPKK